LLDVLDVVLLEFDDVSVLDVAVDVLLSEVSPSEARAAAMAAASGLVLEEPDVLDESRPESRVSLDDVVPLVLCEEAAWFAAQSDQVEFE